MLDIEALRLTDEETVAAFPEARQSQTLGDSTRLLNLVVDAVADAQLQKVLRMLTTDCNLFVGKKSLMWYADKLDELAAGVTSPEDGEGREE